MSEGGASDISIADQVVLLKKRYRNSMKSPMTPTYNAVISMLFMNFFMAGILNTQNADLMKWSNFGPNGMLKVGDQINLLLGWVLLLGSLTLFVALIVNIVCHVPWMFNFGKKVVGTEYILKRKTNHKWFLFTMA